MPIAARLDEFGKPAWIALLVVSFMLFWPVGLLILGYLIGSGRMGCWMHGGGNDRWQRRMDRMQRGVDRMQQGMERMRSAADRWNWNPSRSPSSGNRAFDEYRAETLRRLEDEQREFLVFLERLRHAKDKAEFDQFMSEHRQRPEGPAPQPQG